MTQFNSLFTALRNSAADPRLAQLEPAVWAAIEDARASARAVWGWRAMVAAVMLTFGAVAGGALTQSSAIDLTPFSTSTPLAPSTLLGQLR